MKLSRKMQQQVESKIRHSMAATQSLMKRGPATGTLPKPELVRAEGNGMDQSK